MRQVLSILFIVLCIGEVQAQSLTGMKETDALLDSAKQYIYTDNAKTYTFVKALEKAGKAGNNIIALAYVNLYYGVLEEANGEMDNALKYYQEAHKQATTSGDKTVLLKVMTAMSTYYINTSNFSACIRTCHEGIKISTAIENREIASQFYNNLSLCYNYMNDTENAIKYIDKSIELKRENSDETALANAYLNKGLLLTNMKKYREGFEYYDAAAAIYLKDTNHVALTQLYINYAWDYTDMKQFRTARGFLTKALAHSQKTGDKIREASVWNAFGYYYRNAGQTDSVEQALKNGYKISLASGNIRNSLEAVKELSLHYDNIGDNKKALVFLKEAWKLNDSLLNEAKVKLARVLNARFEATQKEALIAGQRAQIAEHKRNLAQRNMWIIAIASLAIAGFAVVYLLYRGKVAKAQREEEQKINSAIFESEQKERIRIARDLHDSIGQKLVVTKMALGKPTEDTNIKNALGLLEKTIEEVRAVSHNLIPGILIFGLVKAIEDLADQINATESIQTSIWANEEARELKLAKQIELSLYRIVQEITSNMVRHANTKEIAIDITAEYNHLQINIRDKGIGFDTQTIELSAGIGWKNIFARVRLLNGQIKVQSTKNVGSAIMIDIPLQDVS